MASRISEIILLGLLLVIFGFVRVYWGQGYPIMFVWKGEFAYKDTFVNLSEIMKMPSDEIAKNSPNVLWQLEEMGIVEGKKIESKKYEYK
jgi:hypothetical protein